MRRLFTIKSVVIIGFLLRLAFMKWGAPIYYGSPGYATNGGDTWAWVQSMQNLIHTGTYTVDPSYEDGKFFRPPGYAFFLMIFYLFSGFNLELALSIASFAQILLDTASIFLIYKLIMQLSKNQTLSILTAIIYCFYPFSLVWTPVLYAESPSLFFTFLTLYLLTKPTGKHNMLIAGISMGFNVLLRVQTIFLLPAIAVYIWKNNNSFTSLFKKQTIIFFLAFGLTYGSWPLRNLFYGKFIPAEEIVNDKHFSEDFVAFMFYIWSVKTDHRPQFDQIIRGEKVEWPAASYLNPGDSARLERLALLCNTCGRGFSHFKYSAGLIKEPILDENHCIKEIAESFNKLRNEQIQQNSFHYFIVVPLGNLKKALLKTNLYDKKSGLVIVVSTILFYLRTLFIILGVIGVWLNNKHNFVPKHFTQLTLTYFALWYFALCFGYRNIEIRYFLSTDVLLLIPASISIFIIFRKFFTKFENKHLINN